MSNNIQKIFIARLIAISKIAKTGEVLTQEKVREMVKAELRINNQNNQNDGIQY